MEDHKIAKRIFGGFDVHFTCPNCAENLVASLEDAGSDENCLHCGQQFQVPGIESKRRIEQMQRAEQKKRDAAAQKQNDEDAPESQRDDDAPSEPPIPQPVGRARRSKPENQIPQYIMLSILAQIFFGVAIVCAVMFLLMLGAALIFMMRGEDTWPLIVAAFALLVGAFMYGVIAQIIKAFMDLVINSWHIRHAVESQSPSLEPYEQERGY